MTDVPSRDQFKHVIQLPVQWGDMDVVGHINNVIYFRYVESGRIAYFDDLLGDKLGTWDVEGPILAEIQCRFIRQLRYPAQIEIGTRTARIGSRSLSLESAIFVRGESNAAASSRAVIVWFSYAEQKAVVVPQILREAIRALEVVAPTE